MLRCGDSWPADDPSPQAALNSWNAAMLAFGVLLMLDATTTDRKNKRQNDVTPVPPF
jgi:hypothetical protein